MKKYKEMIRILEISNVSEQGNTHIPKIVREILGIQGKAQLVWSHLKINGKEYIIVNTVV